MMEKVKLGLVGLNYGESIIRREILSGIGKDYVRLVAVCDFDQAKAETYGLQYAVKVHADFDRLLADPDVDAVVLITPPFGRAELIRKCIRAGKHVMTTKPFELDPEEALNVLYEARKYGIVVHLNSPGPRPAMDIAKINEWREKYALGQPIAARWETYGRYYETADSSWMDSPDKCPVAPIFRLGIYGINELIELLGMVETIQVAQSRIFTGRPTPDNAELIMQFENGAIGSVFSSFCIGDGMPYPASLVVHYENGTISKRQKQDGSSERRADFKTVELKLKCIHTGEFIEDCFEFSPEHRSGAYQWRNFYEAIRNGRREEEIPPEKIASGIAIIKAMREAEKSRKIEKVAYYNH